MGATRYGIESRTREATIGHLQLFEVREGAPLRRDSARELVVIFVAVATTQIEPHERRRHLLRQRPCARDCISELAMLTGRYAARDTLQGALRQVEIHDVVAELSDVARQREARRVAVEFDLAAVDLHADERERQLTWRKRASVARPGALVVQHPLTESKTLTFELIPHEVEHLQ